MLMTAISTVIAAAEHPLLDLDWTVALQFGIFLLMLLVLSQLLFKPFLKVHEQRQKATEGARHEAAVMTDKATADGVIYEDKMSKARAKALEERAVLRTETTKREREIVATGRTAAEQHLEKTKQIIRDAGDKARTELAPRVTELSLEMAKKILGREVRS
ncbi:MAG: hypothetical protein IT370_16205 [Deltaproteobacteria bacterium]|nr:hypothetical protein [Deltaproteobacteria bacterium]